MIRLTQPSFGPEVVELVLEVLASGRLAQGPMVERLESLAAAMAGTTHAVAVSNGTAALETALELVGAGPGDEVVTSPLTFPATLNAILRTGATARFADVRPDYTVDPASVASLVGPRTKAVLPVHLFGLPADMEAVDRLARLHGLPVVEDACQAHGAACGDRRVGSFGLGCFSLYPTKNVPGGEGGLITTSDDELAQRARLLRNQGMDGTDGGPRVVGHNVRMTDLQAAVAVPQFALLDAATDRRRGDAERLSALLAAVPGLTLPAVPVGRTHVWHQYTVVLPEGCHRAGLSARMRAAGVDSKVHYRRVAAAHPAYEHHPGVARDDTPVARSIVERWISLPVHPGIGPDGADRVAEVLAAAL